MDLDERVKAELELLRRGRDELRVQIHLGKAEAKEAFERTEHKFEEIEGMLRLVAREAGKPLHEIGKSLRDLMHEVKVGYGRVRELL